MDWKAFLVSVLAVMVGVLALAFLEKYIPA